MFGGFNFGGFHSQGDDDDRYQGSGNVDNTKYYQILEVSKDASQTDIKKSYLKLAKQYHPDKNGGSSDKFKEISEAYQTLSDPEKRRLYDKFGTKGLSGSPSGGHDDLLNMFFGGGRGGSRRKQMAKVKPTKKALQVNLESIYNGQLKKVPNKRTRCCQTCQGKGGKNIEKCPTCKGRGQVVQMYQMGPGMYQQVTKNCDKCRGQGQIIGQGGKCKTCNGQKIIEKQVIVEVPIQKGIPNNQPIVINGQGNEIPDALAGDLIFIVQQKQHQIFSRKGADLIMKKKINLVEALTGLQFTLKHLDGNQYVITAGKGQIIGDHQKKVIRGLGMPFYKNQMSHGNLIIEFQVQMPKRGSLTSDKLNAFAAILPGKVNPRTNGDYQMMEDYDAEHVNTNQEGGRKPKQQEQEQAEGAHIGGCQSQ